MRPTGDLSPRELAALVALQKISAGESCFLNVLDADLLVRKGLAEMFGKGQFILTDEGHDLLKKIRGTSIP